MAIKESSDELNPAVAITEAPISRTRDARSAKDYLALAIATCGVGYLPLAPGTWGSLMAVGFYLSLRLAVYGRFSNSLETAEAFFSYAFLAAELLAITASSLLGVWAASRTERLLSIKDPGKVVVDEVAGQLIALLPVPMVVDGFWWVWIVLAFILFRFFDIVKPYPARRFESLHGGLGIMADDMVAGVYAAIVVAVAIIIRWSI
ncbi:MAG: phosphatidylglycerophosphatase A family protein [Pyrinomonadaceae bacterium]